MNESKELLTTTQKARTINFDGPLYGTFAEIGAGKEVAREFFHAGGASGTIAKSISAYDMVFSDAIYGKAPRYVSRAPEADAGSRIRPIARAPFGEPRRQDEILRLRGHGCDHKLQGHERSPRLAGNSISDRALGRAQRDRAACADVGQGCAPAPTGTGHRRAHPSLRGPVLPHRSEEID